MKDQIYPPLGLSMLKINSQFNAFFTKSPPSKSKASNIQPIVCPQASHCLLEQTMENLDFHFHPHQIPPRVIPKANMPEKKQLFHKICNKL